MGTKRGRNSESMETILTFDNRDNQSEWSVEWSTEHVPGMDNAARTGPQRRAAGRRRLRLCSLAVGSALVTHCTVAAAALTGGVVVFYLSLVGAVVLLSNPLRHFEVYLGQWSISGPGRAFRMIPMLDGIGIAICINSIVRAICCCYVAAIAALYVVHTASDAELPFTNCRDWDINQYEPIKINATSVHMRQGRFSLASVRSGNFSEARTVTRTAAVGVSDYAWRKDVRRKDDGAIARSGNAYISVEMCNETYAGGYPSLYSSPAYNYFYVELTRFRVTSSYDFKRLNVPLLICNIFIWVLLWFFMIIERICHGRLIWNNVYPWFVSVPWIWTLLLAGTSAFHVSAPRKILFQEVFKVTGNEILTSVTDAFQTALYIHSASTGTEIIHGKGLNHYAAGHIDPDLDTDSVWHSGLLLLLAALHCGSAAVCALVDIVHPSDSIVHDSHYNMRESELWIIPMYSRCTSNSLHGYTHAVSSLIFAGLSFSYVLVAYTLLKTALHTIFEYRVKLVFVEQIVVAGLMICCMGLSVPFFTPGGLSLMESMQAMMLGVTMPFVCLLELVALLYVYRSHDFLSDIKVATEENTCATRISTQWQIIPLITLGLLVSKIVFLVYSELPSEKIAMSVAPLLATVLAVPLRGVHNAVSFLTPHPRRGT